MFQLNITFSVKICNNCNTPEDCLKWSECDIEVSTRLDEEIQDFLDFYDMDI
jgi:hypothetical protein